MEEWCGGCGDFFPEDEFDELNGVVYHRTADGDPHQAEEVSVEEAGAG